MHVSSKIHACGSKKSAGLPVGWGIWVENSDIKVLSNLPPQKPLAAMSRRAPSWTLDEAPVRDSPVCRSFHCKAYKGPF